MRGPAHHVQHHEIPHMHVEPDMFEGFWSTPYKQYALAAGTIVVNPLLGIGGLAAFAIRNHFLHRRERGS